MAALTENRTQTKEREGDRREFPVKAATRIFAGAMVFLDANGVAVSGSTALGLKSVGRAEKLVDNTSGADGDLSILTRRGVFRWGNSATADEITRSDINATCYAVDDQTVAKTDGTNTRSPAGTIFDVDDQGVWVEIP